MRLAVNDGDRAAPIALPRDAPVAQPVIDFSRALRRRSERLLFETVRGFFEGGRRRKPVEEPRIDQRAVIDIGLVRQLERLGVFAGRQDDGHDGKVVAAREIHVALVPGGAAEDGARAVVHQNEIRDVDGQLPALVERVHGANAGIVAALFSRFDIGDGRAHAPAFVAELGELGIFLGRGFRQRMVGRDGQE